MGVVSRHGEMLKPIKDNNLPRSMALHCVVPEAPLQGMGRALYSRLTCAAKTPGMPFALSAQVTTVLVINAITGVERLSEAQARIFVKVTIAAGRSSHAADLRTSPNMSDAASSPGLLRCVP